MHGYLAAFLALNIVAILWTSLHLWSTIAVGIFYNRMRFPWTSGAPYLSEARSSFVGGVGGVVNLLVTTVTQFVSFVASFSGYILLACLLLILGYVLANNQQEVMVGVSNSWDAFYTVAVFPARSAVNVLFLILEILVGVVNFVSQYVWTAFLSTSRLLLNAQGYFPSIFDNFSSLASSIVGFVTAFASWLTSLQSVGLNPANIPTLALANSTFRPIRLTIFDLYLRVAGTCPAENGLLSIPIIGVLDNATTTVDELLECAVNALVSLPEAFLVTVVVLTRNNTYVPPNVDVFFDEVVCTIAKAASVANQVFFNLVEYLEQGVAVFASSGRRLLQTPGIVWVPTPVFSIPATYAITVVDAVRMGSVALFNVQYFFEPWSNMTNATVWPYKLLNSSRVFGDVYAFTDAVAVNVGGIYPEFTTLPAAAARDFVNLGISYWEFGWQAATRLLVGYDLHDITRFDNSYAGYPSCMTNHSHKNSHGYNNFWTSLYDVMGVFDATVTHRYNELAVSVGQAIVPYFPPVGTLLNLAIIHQGNMHSVILRQLVYFTTRVLLWKQPYYMCIIDLGVPLGVLTDNLLEAVPDLTTYFLDVATANQIQNAHFNCVPYRTENFMLAGGAKAFFFAEMMCNARYINGRLVTCEFGHAADCPTYALPFAELDTNLLCALDGLAISAVLRSVHAQRVIREYVQKQLIESVACIIGEFAPSKYCNLSSLISMQEQLSELAVLGCGTWELTVRVSNVVASLLSFFFNAIYTDVNVPGTSAITYNKQTTNGNLHKYYTARHTSSTCAAQNTEVACYHNSGPNMCEWYGASAEDTSGNACVVNTNSQLQYQKFPLEAATATFVNSVLAPIFWGEYLGYVQAARFAQVFDVPALSLNNFAQVIIQITGELAFLVEVDEYFIILDTIRVVVLSVRDFIVAAIEVFRTFLFVINGCNGGTKCAPLSGGFKQFEMVILDIVNLIELFVERTVGTALALLVQSFYIVTDMLQIVTGSNPTNALNDILERMFCPSLNQASCAAHKVGTGVFWTVLQMLENVIFNMPGIKVMCPIIQIMISILKATLPILCRVLNAIIGVINWFCDDCMGGFSMPCDIGSSITCGGGGSQTNPEPTRCQTNEMCIRSSSAYGSGADYQANFGSETTYCVVYRPDQCNSTYYTSTSAAFDDACQCDKLTSQTFHCNYATGFCQEGISPFGDPLPTCPTGDALVNPANPKSAFVDSSPYFNSLCFVLPVYKCAYPPYSLNGNASIASRLSCIEHMLSNAAGGLNETSQANSDYNLNSRAPALLGPYLCKDYCSPSAFSGDNHLLDGTDALSLALSISVSPTAKSALQAFGCLCAVGWSVGAGQPPPQPSQDFEMYGSNGSGYVNYPATLVLGGFASPPTTFSGAWNTSYPPPFPPAPNSSSFGAPFPPSVVYPNPPRPPPRSPPPSPATGRHLLAPGASACTSTRECDALGAMCALGDVALSCLSCPMQFPFFDQVPAAFCAQSRLCECTSVPGPSWKQLPHLEWQGDSGCAHVGEAYANGTTLGALEYVELRHCIKLHGYGQTIARLSGLSPRVAYDKEEAIRVAGHVSAGVVLGLLHTKAGPDLDAFFAQLHIDPAYALPVARVISESTVILPKVGAFIRRLPSTADVKVSALKMLQVVRRSWSLAKLAYPALGAGERHLQSEVELRRQVFEESVVRRLFTAPTSNGTNGQNSTSTLFETCPLLNVFVKDFNEASTLLAKHLTYDVPRSACRTAHPWGGGSWEDCPPPSWLVNVTPTGPEAPPAPPAPLHPPQNASNSSGSNGTSQHTTHFWLTDGLFALVRKATGVDLAETLDHALVSFHLSGSANVRGVERAVSSALHCSYATAEMCIRNNGTLLNEIFIFAVSFVLLLTALRTLNLGFIAGIAGPVLILLAWPIIARRTYSLPFSCSITFFPVIPVCFVSDLQDLVYQFTPAHLPWPSPLVNRSSYPLHPADVFDCTTIGFGNGVTELGYYIFRYAPGLLPNAPSALLSLLSGTSVVYTVAELKTMGSNHTAIYDQCAGLYSFTVFPVLVLLFILVVYSLLLVHLLFICFGAVVGVLKNIFFASICFYDAVVDASLEKKAAEEEESAEEDDDEDD
jgi:hypothetical protein